MTVRGWPLEHYKAVAEVYVEALGDPLAGKGRRATNVCVAEAWGVPLTTANRWVKRAKELGLLETRRCSHGCPLHCPVRGVT